MKKLDAFDRIPLAVLPTPLYRLDNMSEHLGVNLYVKRDDMTGVALGGNKVRKLEYLLAYAMKQGYDYVMTTGGAQSNHAMLTAMCCNRLGLGCILVLMQRGICTKTGNLLINEVSGADVRFVDSDSYDDIYREMDAIAQSLAKEGHKAYIVPMGGSVPTGSLGYVGCMEEAAAQSAALNVSFNHIVCCTGSGGTLAGVTLGARLHFPEAKVTGVAVGVDDFKTIAAGLVNGTAELMELDMRLTPADINVYDCYGEGYAIPSPEGNAAMKLMARKEGILLDPVYTGKAFAGLMQLVESGYIKKGDDVLFVHTGGAGGIFAKE